MGAKDGEVCFLASSAIEASKSVIKRKFEDSKVPRRLFYHDTIHTGGVIDRATKIADTMNLSNDEVMLAQIAAAFHDVVQFYQEVPKPDGSIIRQRLAGANERHSAISALTFLKDEGGDIMTPSDEAIIIEAILVTVPGWSVEHSTVFQPALNPGSHSVTRAVALADVGASGMDPVLFAKEGLNLFAEEQIDIAMVLSTAKKAGDIDGETQAWYRARLLAWLKVQAGFARGRQALLPRELEGLTTLQKEQVTGLFSRFEESIDFAEDAVERFKAMEFVPMARSLIPGAFPGE